MMADVQRELERFLRVCRPWADGSGYYDPEHLEVLCTIRVMRGEEPEELIDKSESEEITIY